MATRIDIEPNRTYATPERADQAAQKEFGHVPGVRYFIMSNKEGRYFPVFIGQESIHAGIYLRFNVVG